MKRIVSVFYFFFFLFEDELNRTVRIQVEAVH